MSDAGTENGGSGGVGGDPSGGAGSLADLKRLGRYKILRELGRGAMGIVFEAVDPKIGRKVALKVLTSVPGISETELEEFRSRFFREARTAGNLSHPNIVIIHDVDHDDELGISYMAMEYLKGQSLYDLLRSGVKFTREQAIDLCIQVAEGLDHAHRQGVIHRDVKPGNLMLLKDGTVKITDFGIAKISTSNLTKTGQFLGTPNYMSPEQVIGHVIDGRSDLFSLGIILYELLTGEKPFMGSSLTTITYQIVNVDPIEPSKIQPGIPKLFDEIVGTLLNKAPDERYQTGKDVAEALRNARDSLGSRPARTTTAPVALSGDATHPAAGAGSVTAAAVQPQPMSAAGAAAGEKSALAALPNSRLLLVGIAGVFLIVAAVLVAVSWPDAPDERAATTMPTADPPEADPATPAALPPEDASLVAGSVDPESGASALDPAPDPLPAPPDTQPAADPAPAKPPPERRPQPETVPRDPEPRPKIVPRQAEPLPLRPRREAPAPAPELGVAEVTLRFSHKLKSGTLTIEVDGEPVASHDFTTDRKRGGSLFETFEISEGTHSIRCCLSSSNMKEGMICAHRQHRFVMNGYATIRAQHQKPPLGKDKFSFSIE